MMTEDLFGAMKKTFPGSAILTEVGPRDGFQFEKKIVPTSLKQEIILRLVDAGFRNIQVTAFVHPHKVPQMADAEALTAILPRISGVAFSALTLNLTGVKRARAAGITHVEASISAGNRHSLNNAGMNANAALNMGAQMVSLAKQYGMAVRAGIQCVFGSGYEEPVPVETIIRTAQSLLDAGADMLCLADTTGMATPVSICRMLDAVMPAAGNIPIVLHLHDTRGLGLVNVMTALSCGITHFDTSMAGMGGCPFIPDAAGNIATEDTLHLLNSLGIDTGLNTAQIAACARDMAAFFGRTFPGKIYRLTADSHHEHSTDGSSKMLPTDMA